MLTQNKGSHSETSGVSLDFAGIRTRKPESIRGSLKTNRDKGESASTAISVLWAWRWMMPWTELLSEEPREALGSTGFQGHEILVAFMTIKNAYIKTENAHGP